MVKRLLVRFWKRNGWRGVLLVATVVLCAGGAGIYSLVHGSATGGEVGALSGGYSFDIPKGWLHDKCAGHKDSRREPTDDGCTKPDMASDAGVYLMSEDVAEGTSPADLTRQLGGTMDNYQPCAGDASCLRNTAHPEERGQLRVRVFKTLAVIEVCLRTDRSDIQRGCDLVWNGIHVRG